jgi:hypothetical protein
MNEETTPQPRRNKLAWLGWILWLTTVGGLYFIRHESAKRDAEIQQNQRALLSWMERADKIMAAVDTNRMVAALAQQDKNLNTLQTRMEADAGGLAETLKQQKELNGRMLATLGPAGGNMEDALKLADDAKTAGNVELSLIYLANAIRSQPNDARLLEKYTSWVLESKNPTVIQGAENLLQQAIYAVAAKDVTTVAKLLEDVKKVQDEPSKIVENADENEVSPASSFAVLEKVPLESWSQDRKKIEGRIEALAAIMEQITESGQEDAKFRDQVSKQLEKAQACALAHQVLDLASLRFANLETTGKLVDAAASDENRTAALSALQATEAAVNQIWSVPMSLITPDLRVKLVELPKKLKDQAGIIQDKVEEDDIEKAREIWKSRRNQEAKYFDWKIIGCQEAIEECSKLLGKVQGPKSLEASAELNRKMYKEMSDLKKGQFNSYQEWATNVIEATRKKYDENKVNVDQHAYDAFYQKEIQKIDQALLAPEVAQFLQAVFSKLLNELNGTGQAQLQKDLSFSNKVTKKRLEDF